MTRTISTLRYFAKVLFKNLSRITDVLPMRMKWKLAQLMPVRYSKPFMKYGKARIFRWKVGQESTFLLKSDFDDDYFELSYLEAFGFYEPQTLFTWEKITKDKNLVLDIGAYTGVFSLIAARKGGSRRCISFEPNPVSYEKLLENVRLNNAMAIIHPVNKGVGEKKQILSLVVPPERAGSSAVQLLGSVVNRDTGQWLEVTNIEVDTIDSMLLDLETSVDAIKIDVEGYELNVLKGASKRLQHDKPLILLECLSYTELVAISEFLGNFGYSAPLSLDGEPMTEYLNESIDDSTRARNYVFKYRD
jgi:FkbM family methyltransferase